MIRVILSEEHRHVSHRVVHQLRHLRKTRFTAGFQDGTEVRIRPRYDSETGRIEVHIEAEVSDLSDDRAFAPDEPDPEEDIIPIPTAVA